VLTVLGCGGGGSSGSSSIQVVVQITPTSVTLAPGGSRTFAATVTGSTNTSVTWTCSAGTIDQSGTYIAPTTTGSYTVTATSAADHSVKAVSQVTVSSSSVVSVTISPSSESVGLGGQVQFAATVRGSTNTAVTWSTTLGKIDSNGLFTAPNAASSCTVTATSVADSSASAKAIVTVTSVGVQITPSAPSIGTNQSLQFSATVTNASSQAVTWTATGGTISSSGLYHAGSAAGSYSVTATSVSNPSSYATVTVTVNAISVSVTPTTATVVTSQTQQFLAKVTGTSSTGVSWTTTGGTINSSGLLTAPATSGTITVTATSTVDTTASASSTVTVVPPSSYFYDFSSGVPSNWTPTTNESTPSGVKFLGRISGTNTAQLVLDSLTTHSSVTVTFDLFVIGAWGGIPSSATLGVSIGGTTAFSQSFSNLTSVLQSYPLSGSNAPGTSSTGQNTLGYTHDPAILYNDTTYHITCTATHTASTITIVFSGNLTGTISDMAWGLKNVQVTANP